MTIKVVTVVPFALPHGFVIVLPDYFFSSFFVFIFVLLLLCSTKINTYEMRMRMWMILCVLSRAETEEWKIHTACFIFTHVAMEVRRCVWGGAFGQVSGQRWQWVWRRRGTQGGEGLSTNECGSDRMELFFKHIQNRIQLGLGTMWEAAPDGLTHRHPPTS